VDLVEDNVIFRQRTQGVGVFTLDQCRSWGVTGPPLRASGVPYDIRKAEPYGAYSRYEFEIPTRPEGDVFARYMVRIAEMQQSVRIIEQALDGLPEGPILTDGSIGVKKRLKLPVGTLYYAVESARGAYGIIIVSEGGSEPYRAKFRTPSYANLGVMYDALPGTMVADAVAVLGSVDLVMPEVDR
jgi:NADH-quinone oxidoreductase subunit D